LQLLQNENKFQKGEPPLRTGRKTAEKKALTHKIYGKAPLEYSFPCENEKCQMKHSFRETLPIFCTNAQKKAAKTGR